MVEVPVAAGVRRAHELGDEGAERDGHAGVAGRRGDDSQVLVVQGDPEAGVKSRASMALPDG